MNRAFPVYEGIFSSDSIKPLANFSSFAAVAALRSAIGFSFMSAG
jgi:hypothetical protein